MRCVYTTILGSSTNRDKGGRREVYRLQEPNVRDTSVSWVCFTDRDDIESRTWEIRKVDCAEDPRRQHKLIKILPHIYLPEFTETLWLDSTTHIRRRASEIFDEVGDCNIGLIRSTERQTPIEEAEAILEHKSDDVDQDAIRAQMARYYSLGYDALPLYHGAACLRRNSDRTTSFCELWLMETQRWCMRDQPGITVAASKSRAKVYELSHGFEGNIPFRFRRAWCQS